MCSNIVSVTAPISSPCFFLINSILLFLLNSPPHDSLCASTAPCRVCLDHKVVEDSQASRDRQENLVTLDPGDSLGRKGYMEKMDLQERQEMLEQL